MSDENWLPIWRGLAVDLLQEGFCSRLSVEKWARKNNFHLRTVRQRRSRHPSGRPSERSLSRTSALEKRTTPNLRRSPEERQFAFCRTYLFPECPQWVENERSAHSPIQESTNEW